MIDFENTIFSMADREKMHEEFHTYPHLYRGIAQQLAQSFSFDDIDRMLTIQGIGHPHIFLLNSKKGIKKLPFYPYTENFARQYSPLKTFQEYIVDGTSILMHNLHRHHPVIAAVHAQLSEKFDTLDKTVCFLSPANSQATRPHADDHPNIVVQLSGRKQWWVWDLVTEEDLNRIQSVKDMEQWLSNKAERSTPLVDTVLDPGDVLLVPQRFLHTAKTLDTHSLSIVLQIRCCTLSVICKRLFEEGLPSNGQQQHYISII